MVTGHPLSAGGLHVRITSHLDISVSLFLMTGIDGTSVMSKNRILNISWRKMLHLRNILARTEACKYCNEISGINIQFFLAVSNYDSRSISPILGDVLLMTVNDETQHFV